MRTPSARPNTVESLKSLRAKTTTLHSMTGHEDGLLSCVSPERFSAWEGSQARYSERCALWQPCLWPAFYREPKLDR